MTGNRHTGTGVGFAAETARADFTTFTRWYDRRCLLPRPTMVECAAILSEPDRPDEEPARADARCGLI